MNLELWGIKGIFYIGLPHRLSGYLLLGLDVIILIILLFIDLRKNKLDKSFRSDRKNRLFALLLFLAPIAAVTLLVQLAPPANIATPGIPIRPTGLGDEEFKKRMKKEQEKYDKEMEEAMEIVERWEES